MAGSITVLMNFLSCILRGGGYTSLVRLIVSLTGQKAVNGYKFLSAVKKPAFTTSFLTA